MQNPYHPLSLGHKLSDFVVYKEFINMKKTKVIIPALGLLLLSTAASVTGTVAWFAANATVTATGMEVTAKSDSVFLEISGSHDAGAYSDIGTAEIEADLLPVSHESWSGVEDIEDFDLAVADTYDNWYYRYSDATDDADSNVTAKQYISSFTDYVATTSFSVKLHAGSADTAYDLYVSSVTIPADTGIHVVIAGADGYVELDETVATIAFNASNIIADEVTQTEQDINVYIFFDGNDENVYSDNILSLTGAVSFKLTASTNDH